MASRSRRAISADKSGHDFSNGLTLSVVKQSPKPEKRGFVFIFDSLAREIIAQNRRASYKIVSGYSKEISDSA